jgi:hypothetical protein
MNHVIETSVDRSRRAAAKVDDALPPGISKRRSRDRHDGRARS